MMGWAAAVDSVNSSRLVPGVPLTYVLPEQVRHGWAGARGAAEVAMVAK